MNTFDNGNTRPLSSDYRTTPQLDGDIYCSPACGAGCKKADFDQASERAQAIAALLGRDWTPRLWENNGWHFSVEKGIASVSMNEELEYVASFMFVMSQTNRVWLEKKGTDPRELIAKLSTELQERIGYLNRALLAVSFASDEISMAPESPHLGHAPAQIE